MSFNLSEKRTELLKSLIGMKDTPMDMVMINSIIGVIEDQDRELIRLLKDASTFCVMEEDEKFMIKEINKLAGPKLTNTQEVRENETL